MKRRIYTTIATLVAIVAVCALVVPTASAEKKRPASSQQTKAQKCEMLKLAHDLAYESAQEARANDDWDGYRTMMDYATANAEAALNLRCSWAIGSRVSQVQTSSGPIIDEPTLNVR
ncbi:MAG TPA: hypothetical protein VH950_08500 [Gaiellaceae bacterium]